MQKIIWMIFLICQTAMAETPAKIYTEEEFQKKLSEEVLKKVESIKNKSVTDLAKELLQKEEMLRQREIQLSKREEIIENSRTDLEKRIIAFDGDQRKILGCVEKNEQDSKKRISQLVEVISNMKPDKASQILSVQDAEISVQILTLIDPIKASKIFNLMDKEVSARLQKQYLHMKK
jgi:flagellar motility protein MotE (MotC chaperone)